MHPELRTTVIAEIANAHQGSPALLMSLVEEASRVGARGVKFQLFKYDHLSTPDFEWYKAYQQLFLSEETWTYAFERASSLGLQIWADVFDDWGLQLAKKLSAFIYGLKIPPTVLQYSAIASQILAEGKPVLLGVGGWYDNEIDDIITGLTEEQLSRIILMHGFQGYPTRLEDATISRIPYLKSRYGLKIGFADHVDGASPLAISLPVYAFFAGAEVIEKHLTLSRVEKGYDYFSSLVPDEFAQMISHLSDAERAFGLPTVTDPQRDYLKSSARMVAKRNIRRGEVLSDDKLALKRSSKDTALMPHEFEKLLPAVAKQDLSENEALVASDLKQPKVVAAIICRLKSVRLPRKAIEPIHGVSSIERCLLNAKAIPKVDEVILATSDLPEDDPLEDYNLGGLVRVVRGSPDNVAQRIIHVAELVDADIILRITGDCPAVSPEIVGYLIAQHFKTGADLTIPTVNHAIGTAGDVYSVEAIKRLLSWSGNLTHTEYLSFYFRNNPTLFRVNNVELPREWQHPEWRLTLDEPDDLVMFSELYKELKAGHEAVSFTRIMEALISNPRIAQINAQVALRWRDNQDILAEIMKATTLSVEE